jgi:ubiquitin C-terminal hydrolase
MALKLFSGLTKSHSFGSCIYCKESIEEFSFSYFIDQNIYLDKINDKCNFKSVLSENFGNYNNLTMNCPKCDKEINIKEEIKFIKLPEILIFTLERYINKINNTLIEPDEIIDMKEYIDNSVNFGNTEYSLFAINIRFGKSNDFGHEICQVKRNGIWYEINDTGAYERIKEYNNNSYGLFYKRL